MTRPRILMADDRSLVLAGLRRLVEDEGDVDGRHPRHDNSTTVPAAADWERSSPEVFDHSV